MAELRVFYRFSVLLTILLVPGLASTAYGQDWPEALANRQVEFELEDQDVAPSDEEAPEEITRGQVGGANVGTVSEPTVPLVLQRDIINPFDTEEVEATPAMQMLPEEITVPELPDPEIQQQINLDEFRNYLNTLVENPPQEAKPELSTTEVKKQLRKIDISALMTSPDPYVVINGQRFKIGDRFSMAVNMPENNLNMERLIQEQMPRENSVPDEVYQEFEAIKQEALEKYRARQAERQSETNADTHNISVIISDIKHRQLMVSVNGREYVIPIKIAL